MALVEAVERADDGVRSLRPRKVGQQTPKEFTTHKLHKRISARERLLLEALLDFGFSGNAAGKILRIPSSARIIREIQAKQDL